MKLPASHVPYRLLVPVLALLLSLCACGQKGDLFRPDARAAAPAAAANP